VNNQYAIYGSNYSSGMAVVGTATLGAGLWGQLDLEGEVREWNLDLYAPYIDPCVDCAYLTVASNRVDRGDDFGDRESFLLTANRGYALPTSRSEYVGFRCARVP
jgi:formylglycine-generating enzyme required for sulfatase activity